MRSALSRVLILAALAACGPGEARTPAPYTLDVPTWLEASDCDAAEVFRAARGLADVDAYDILRATASCRRLASVPGEPLDLERPWKDSPGERLAEERWEEAALGAIDLMAGGRALARVSAAANQRIAAQEVTLVEVLLAAVPHLDAPARSTVVQRLAELDRRFPAWDPEWEVDHGLNGADLAGRRSALVADLRTRSDGRPREGSLGLAAFRVRQHWIALRAVLLTTGPVAS